MLSTLDYMEHNYKILRKKFLVQRMYWMYIELKKQSKKKNKKQVITKKNQTNTNNPPIKKERKKDKERQQVLKNLK